MVQRLLPKNQKAAYDIRADWLLPNASSSFADLYCCDNHLPTEAYCYYSIIPVNLPVSIKTRTGIKQHQTEEWISRLLEAGPAAVILHARTQRMQSDGDADWEQIAKAVNVKNSINPSVPLIGNGDVLSYADGIKKLRKPVPTV